MKLFLATRNRDKVREIKSVLGGLCDRGLEIHTLDEHPALYARLQWAEDGATFEENALKKARAVYQATGLPTLADDSGLEVFYLNNRPGVYSSRYAGEGCTYEDNIRKLLWEMRGVPQRRRGARFRCVVAFVDGAFEKVVEGVVEGTIAEEPRGTNGFGYDPLFVPLGYQQTFAELPPEIKNQISHRAKALAEIIRLWRTENWRGREQLAI